MRNIVKVSIAAAFIFMIGIVILVIFTNNYISGKADNSNEDIATLNNIAVTAEENRQDLSALDKKDFEALDYREISKSKSFLLFLLRARFYLLFTFFLKHIVPYAIKRIKH